MMGSAPSPLLQALLGAALHLVHEVAGEGGLVRGVLRVVGLGSRVG